MSGLKRRETQFAAVKRVVVAIAVVAGLLATTVVTAALGAIVTADTASARGPAYGGPQTTADGPAYFGPAPNPLPYCDNPTYFDPWDENVTPTGRLDVGDTASVTTDGMTMDLEILAEGSPGEQYPGFFPFGGEGVANDRAKGFEVAPGDSAVVRLDQPLFYAQFIFTDVDQPGEGFSVIPDWAIQGEVIAYGGDGQFTFAGTTPTDIRLDDLDGVGHPSEAVEGRAQLDMLGAVNGITFTRPATRIDPDTGNVIPTQGQSGLSVAGGCEASGAAKRVSSGPTWNGTSFEVTYELRFRNNMPTAQTILEVVAEAQANAQTTFSTADPTSIPLDDIRLTDQLGDPAFSQIVVTDVSTATPNLILNDDYDGLGDDQLLLDGSFLAAESDALITLTVEYTPDATRAEWTACTTGYDYLNQSIVEGTVGGIAVSDESDDGIDPTPSSENGSGGVDDPTPVLFPCPPAGLDIVKTVVPGPSGTCPDFANGVVGEGPALPVIVDDTVTYCISVANPALGTATDVVITDAQAPQDFTIGSLPQGQSATVSYDVQVDLATPAINTASAIGSSVNGPLGPVQDTAAIIVSPKPQPNLEIVKTVVRGPNGTCPAFADGTPGRGVALQVDDQDTVTYCVSVRNTGPGDATNVMVADDQAPQDYSLGTLISGAGQTISYDLVVDLGTQPINIAFAFGDGPDGPLTPVQDDAEIAVSALQPALDIVKTVLPGPGATCPEFALGVAGPGTPLAVVDGETVTYCVSVRNAGRGIATNVVVTDAQAPGPFDIGTLGSGEEGTVSYDVVVGLATPTTNTAIADGEGPDGALDQVNDTAVIAVSPLPEPVLEIVKTALRGPGATCPDFDGGVPGQGDAVEFVETETVTYCITVRNTGPGDATNVAIIDDQAPNTFDLSVGALASGDEATRSFEIEVFIDTPAVNVATANGDGPYGAVAEVSDDALISVSLQPDPVLQIVKTVVEGPNGSCPDFDDGVVGDGDALPVLYGDTVTYCISVRNVGDNPATSVQVSDAQAPGVFSVGELAVGAVATRDYDIEVGETTPVQNTATATGLGPNGQLPEVSDTALIDPSPQPDPILEIVKTAIEGPNGTCPAFVDGVVGDGDALSVFFGDTVTYCISVRNVGERPATNVSVADAQAPETFSIGELAVDAEATRSYDIEVGATTESLNTATATGEGPNGDLPEVSDTALIDPNPQPDPQLNIVKTVVLGPGGVCPSYENGVTGVGEALRVELGDTVTYCVSVRNTGARDATEVVITDEQAPGPIDIGTLAVGATSDHSYDVVVDEDTPLVNIAVVTGDGPNGELPEDEDDAQINTADIELVHTVIRTDRDCDDTVRDVDILVVDLEGLDVRWCYRITNTGNVPLTNVSLSSADIGFTSLDALENAGVSFIITESGDLAIIDSDELVPADGRLVGVADAVGDVLLPGETITLDVTSTIPGGGLESAADVIADPADENGDLLGLDPVTDADEAEVREGLIELTKTVAPGDDATCASSVKVLRVPAGTPVTWCFEVTNVGTLDLRVVEVVDDTLGVVVAVPVEQQVLEPDATFTLTLAAESPGAVENEATVEGTALDDDGEVIDQAPIVRDSDTAEIELPTADLSIDKQVSDRGPVAPGTVLTYTLQVANAGPDAATEVVVTDRLPTGLRYQALPAQADWACSLDADQAGFRCLKGAALAAGQAETLAYTVVVSGTAPRGASLENVASVTSTTEDPDPTNNTDEETTTVADPPPDEEQVIDDPPPEYPGPFTIEDPPPAEVPDEVLGLAITGASSRQLVLLALAMIAFGGLMLLGGRRSRRDEPVT